MFLLLLVEQNAFSPHNIYTTLIVCLPQLALLLTGGMTKLEQQKHWWKDDGHLGFIGTGLNNLSVHDDDYDVHAFEEVLWAIFNTFYKLFITVNTKYSESMK
jgi:hypothetical protein